MIVKLQMKIEILSSFQLMVVCLFGHHGDNVLLVVVVAYSIEGDSATTRHLSMAGNLAQEHLKNQEHAAHNRVQVCNFVLASFLSLK